jgi:hypothetical protein
MLRNLFGRFFETNNLAINQEQLKDYIYEKPPNLGNCLILEPSDKENRYHIKIDINQKNNQGAKVGYIELHKDGRLSIYIGKQYCTNHQTGTDFNASVKTVSECMKIIKDNFPFYRFLRKSATPEQQKEIIAAALGLPKDVAGIIQANLNIEDIRNLSQVNNAADNARNGPRK